MLLDGDLFFMGVGSQKEGINSDGDGTGHAIEGLNPLFC